MDTPIFDFVSEYAKNGTVRLHMPGHKGQGGLGCEIRDITEVKGADELFHPSGIIKKSEENASSLFKTAKTLYSAGGSTQSIQAMVYLAFLRAPKNSRPLILAGRNAHRAFISAVSKLDCDVNWLSPDFTPDLCSCEITPDMLLRAISSADRKPFAVYITSPDYLGKITPIKPLAELCREKQIPLLVDNAHGSYLAFCTDLHPMHNGADMCCDSAHKTLPVLTGGGYLHINRDDFYGFSENARQAMELFGSSSPSYLILQSLDLCNRYIEMSIEEDLKLAVKSCEKIRRVMTDKGIEDFSDEPLKITADFRRLAPKNADWFRAEGIEPEYDDGDFTVFMASCNSRDGDFKRLADAFEKIELKEKAPLPPISLTKAKRALSVREAVFSPSVEIECEKAEGRICASPTVSCPPAIPIAVSGEIIDKNHRKLFERYNIKKIRVVSE